MYRTSIRLPQRCTQRDNRNSLVFAPNAIALVRARFLQQFLAMLFMRIYAMWRYNKNILIIALCFFIVSQTQGPT